MSSQATNARDEHPADEHPVPGEGGKRRGEPRGMTRRTYYFSEQVAEDLAAAVARLHHGSQGRITKHAALDAIIAAGVEQLDAIERRLRPGA